MVRITYYGHACFEVSTEQGSVILDPYADGSVPGLKLPRNLTADAVYCSHGHADHNAAQLIRLSGREDSFPVSFITVPHDDAGGTKRGMTRMTFISADGVLIAHLGDIGRMPTVEEYRQLQKADIVMLPCAGFFTISSKQAEEIIRNLKKPSLKILMHFREGNRGYDVQEDIGSIMKNIPGVSRFKGTSVDIDPEAVPDEVITMEPEQ